MADKIPFDYAAWRVRLGWSKEQAEQALGVSRTYYWKAEKEGAASRMCAWAAYGLEAFEASNRRV